MFKKYFTKHVCDLFEHHCDVRNEKGNKTQQNQRDLNISGKGQTPMS